eukprot:CAMPEP_0170437724 /NCGR_PEP_ID=MMETSP0117_2-20130122/44843_1 /TAXON_ID=400756 /ORGANISM="Durinskia baltica, Strain CSIRO CS-38" /LENGTH=37 /DNA_ID= /DNA_START= /DNA_END= /DNA_ORIENTATION=
MSEHRASAYSGAVRPCWTGSTICQILYQENIKPPPRL